MVERPLEVVEQLVVVEHLVEEALVEVGVVVEEQLEVEERQEVAVVVEEHLEVVVVHLVGDVVAVEVRPVGEDVREAACEAGARGRGAAGRGAACRPRGASTSWLHVVVAAVVVVFPPSAVRDGG